MNLPRRKRVLVTGASSGIGLATVQILLEEGWDVAVTARRRKPLDQLAASGPVNRGEVLVLPCDLENRAACDAMVTELLDVWPGIDAVVLNAGVAGRTPLDAPDTDRFDRIVELNLVAPLRLLRQLLPAVEDGGRIIAIASVLARFGVPDLHAYCASKAGLVGAVRALALDLGPRRITVNAILPGWVDTAMARDNIVEQAPGMGLSAEEATAFFMTQIPLGRFLEPGEIGGQVRHLLSDASAGITGQALNVCCGVMA